MHKFFVDSSDFVGDLVRITGDDVKHIYKVLRLKVGDRVAINNLLGEEFLCELTKIDKKEVEAEIIEKLQINNESAVRVDLLQGMPKGAKMDLISQKCTELGINSIKPVLTERVVVEKGNWEKKLDRWQRIILEACKQSKRSLIPQIDKPMSFEDLLNVVDNYDLVVVPYENAENYGMKKMFMDMKSTGVVEDIKSVAIVVGPEGGFEEKEIEELKQKGAKIITLGKRILRTETAGFTALSIIMYELCDLGGEI